MARKLPDHKIKPHGLCEKCAAFGQVLEFMVPDFQYPRLSHDTKQTFDQSLVDHRYRPFHLCERCANPDLSKSEAMRAAQAKQNEKLMRELAEVLHEARCLGPHEGNGCLFPKETDWESPSRQEWLRKAAETRESMASLSIQDIIRVLKAT